MASSDEQPTTAPDDVSPEFRALPKLANGEEIQALNQELFASPDVPNPDHFYLGVESQVALGSLAGLRITAPAGLGVLFLVIKGTDSPHALRLEVPATLALELSQALRKVTEGRTSTKPPLATGSVEQDMGVLFRWRLDETPQGEAPLTLSLRNATDPVVAELYLTWGEARAIGDRVYELRRGMTVREARASVINLATPAAREAIEAHNAQVSELLSPRGPSSGITVREIDPATR